MGLLKINKCKGKCIGNVQDKYIGLINGIDVKKFLKIEICPRKVFLDKVVPACSSVEGYQIMYPWEFIVNNKSLYYR